MNLTLNGLFNPTINKTSKEQGLSQRGRSRALSISHHSNVGF